VIKYTAACDVSIHLGTLVESCISRLHVAEGFIGRFSHS
jgi:hypothetical protein